MDFSRWDRDQLVEYLSFLFRSYRAMDAFWFINIEKGHGLEEACRINELVWGKIAQLDARDLKKRFSPGLQLSWTPLRTVKSVLGGV